MDPFTATALLTLINQGVQAGTGHLAQRRQENFAKKRAGLQDVLQGLNPQTAGQQPERRGQEGWESHIASAVADPLVQKWMENKLGLGEDQSTKRATLPDASQAVGRSGPLGGPMVDETNQRRQSAASRAVAAPSPANPNRSTWTQEGTRTNFGPLAPPTAKDGPWTWWNKAPAHPSTIETAWAWPDGRRVTMEELRSQPFNPAWKRVHPMPSGARTPRSATSKGGGGLLDSLFSGLRG